ncbi:MAG: cytochrome c biogenesis protein CcsA [Planctomycetota bacterium]
MPVAVLIALLFPTGCRKAEPLAASQKAAELDRRIDWRPARMIVVQDGMTGFYKTLDSFARDSFSAMTRQEHLPGLSPLGSLFEWMFNSQAYLDAPLIKVREAGLRARLTEHLPREDRDRIMRDGRFSPRELADPAVERVLARLESERLARRAAGKLRTAQAFADRLDELLTIVPHPGTDKVAAWYAPQQMVGSLTDEQLAVLQIERASLPEEIRFPVPDVSPEQAWAITRTWSNLRGAWLRGDAEQVQTQLDELAAYLPTMAPPGAYRSPRQLQAEVQYYRFGKFTWGWLLYFTGFVFSIWALVTRWRSAWGITLAITVAAFACHAFGVGLRWYVLGRIPLANMFEAVIGATALAVGVTLVLELIHRTRFFLTGANFAGFLALVLGDSVVFGREPILPGSELTRMMGILDHLQLRIHTVMITFSYALIFIAAVIAVIYLIGSYRAALGGALGSGGGLGVGAVGGSAFVSGGQRPLLAGGLPGDEQRRGALPQWLNNLDWCHLIILNIVFVMLFVGGVVMGAIWADESWGRPWGWDPKEVFALNTWIVYAILIHVRFIVQNRGLWTAWLSVLGCAVMAFNWYYVNFFISSIHSYA